jgi:hypothetical protein
MSKSLQIRSLRRGLRLQEPSNTQCSQKPPSPKAFKRGLHLASARGDCPYDSRKRRNVQVSRQVPRPLIRSKPRRLVDPPKGAGAVVSTQQDYTPPNNEYSSVASALVVQSGRLVGRNNSDRAWQSDPFRGPTDSRDALRLLVRFDCLGTLTPRPRLPSPGPYRATPPPPPVRWIPQGANHPPHTLRRAESSSG